MKNAKQEGQCQRATARWQVAEYAMDMPNNISSGSFRHVWWLGLLALLVVVLASMLPGRPAERSGGSAAGSELPVSKGQNADAKASRPPRFATRIRRPSGPPTIELTQADPQGRVGEVACSTCHSVREPNSGNRQPSDLDEFHQDMKFTHGTLACYACHNPADSDKLRLAEGAPLEYSDVMTLCAQCHGPQARDYAHGAHGGMTGYWDLSRGPRLRNNCIDCHDPHVPQFPRMVPTFKPRDRFLNPHVPPEREARGE